MESNGTPVLALLGILGSVATQSASAAQCPKGAYPVAILGASSASIYRADPTRLPPEMIESSILCVRPAAGSTLPAEFVFVDRAGLKKNRLVSRETFTSSGFQSMRKIPVYGEIDIISMSCKNCNWQNQQQSMKVVARYQFPKWSSPIPITLKLNPSSERWEIQSQDRAVHAIIFEKEGAGLKRIRFSQCPETQEEACLMSANPSMLKTHSIVELQLAK